MRIPQEILDQVRDDPLAGAIAACEFVESSLEPDSAWQPDDEELLFEIYGLISTLHDAKRIEYIASEPDINAAFPHSCGYLSRFMNDVKEQLESNHRSLTKKRKFEQLKKHFSLTINDAFGYEFTDGDLKRIQQLLNELREMISANTELDADHKQRLLKRLEEMQREMHKKISDLGRFYSFVGEAGVMLGKLGKDAKPLVDRMRELAGIAWNAQARAEELPSGSDLPMLGNDSQPPAIE
ncbi:hypothetical protein ASE98_16805 [Pseudomonas sp. Leaf48]|uniref:hypothetical protein n=1 Tax=Pseudomonas sp. Leaf48 TaxID=1736221 RepID=UPI000729F974|nr:hypothetical protein [Pseudomonas sp. Leaf48]KQN54625.1 hypothetical protein ASE98_16805 [Pseudomonas sp. Leaf48]